jgi:hypothetical protein
MYHQMPLLEYLGIPRIRVRGISIFNVFGTIAVAYLITKYCTFLEPYVDFFQMSCLLIVLAIVTHYSLGDYTPLVKLVMHDKLWRVYPFLLTFTGIFGWTILKYWTILYGIFLLLKE